MISVGCSFDPSRFDKKADAMLPALRFIVEDLKITDIRLGLRWNRIEMVKNKIDFISYRSCLDYLIEKNALSVLNIGPVKTLGYPESHLPDFIDTSNFKKKPGNFFGGKLYRNKIKLDSELSSEATRYTELLLLSLKSHYSNWSPRIIQIENEVFTLFGKHHLIGTFDYLFEILKKVKNHYPSSKILINSSNRFNLNKIFKFIKFIDNTKLYRFSDFTIGYDFYYDTTDIQSLKWLYVFGNTMDISFPWDMTLSKLKQLSTKYGFKVEITEMQFEPWKGVGLPGNDYNDFNKALIEGQRIFPPTQGSRVVRLWGVERLATKYLENTLTTEHQKIIDRIIGQNTN